MVVGQVVILAMLQTITSPSEPCEKPKGVTLAAPSSRLKVSCIAVGSVSSWPLANSV